MSAFFFLPFPALPGSRTLPSKPPFPSLPDSRTLPSKPPSPLSRAPGHGLRLVLDLWRPPRPGGASRPWRLSYRRRWTAASTRTHRASQPTSG